MAYDKDRTSLESIWDNIKQRLSYKAPARLFILPIITAVVVYVIVDKLSSSGWALFTSGLSWLILFFIEDNKIEKEELKRKSNNGKNKE